MRRDIWIAALPEPRVVTFEVWTLSEEEISPPPRKHVTFKALCGVRTDDLQLGKGHLLACYESRAVFLSEYQKLNVSTVSEFNWVSRNNGTISHNRTIMRRTRGSQYVGCRRDTLAISMREITEMTRLGINIDIRGLEKIALLEGVHTQIGAPHSPVWNFLAKTSPSLKELWFGIGGAVVNVWDEPQGVPHLLEITNDLFTILETQPVAVNAVPSIRGPPREEINKAIRKAARLRAKYYHYCQQVFLRRRKATFKVCMLASKSVNRVCGRLLRFPTQGDDSARMAEIRLPLFSRPQCPVSGLYIIHLDLYTHCNDRGGTFDSIYDGIQELFEAAEQDVLVVH